jgi:large subunit ribosomal protein L15
MKYNELNMSSNKNATRVGRGIAAGKGKTAGRGTKGQKSRTGSKKRPGFAGGQTPLMIRIPKLHGFKSYKVKSEIITTRQLENLGLTKVDNQTLFDLKLTSSPFAVVKVLSNGNLSKKISISLQSASNGAIEVIEKAGGKFNRIDRIRHITKKAVEKDIADN